MCIAKKLENLSRTEFVNPEFTQYGILKLASEKNAKYHNYKRGKMLYQFIDGSGIVFDDKRKAYSVIGH